MSFYSFLSVASTGIITTTSFLDYESNRAYSLIITSSDNGTPPRELETFFVISVVDENDNTPQFRSQSNTATIPENSASDSFVIDLAATDADSGSNAELSYSILNSGQSDVFRIDSTSGMVFVQQSEALDFEMMQTFVLQVQVVDSGVPPASSQTLVSWSVELEHYCAHLKNITKGLMVSIGCVQGGFWSSCLSGLV